MTTILQIDKDRMSELPPHKKYTPFFSFLEDRTPLRLRPDSIYFPFSLLLHTLSTVESTISENKVFRIQGLPIQETVLDDSAYMRTLV
jgi:hypothetical protein